MHIYNLILILTEQKQEKDFLQERSVQLKNKLQDIKREAEYLSQKMAVS